MCRIIRIHIFSRTINTNATYYSSSKITKNIDTIAYISRLSKIKYIYFLDPRQVIVSRFAAVAREREKRISPALFPISKCTTYSNLCSAKAWNKGEATPFYENYISHFIFAFRNGRNPYMLHPLHTLHAVRD